MAEFRSCFVTFVDLIEVVGSIHSTYGRANAVPLKIDSPHTN